MGRIVRMASRFEDNPYRAPQTEEFKPPPFARRLKLPQSGYNKAVWLFVGLMVGARLVRDVPYGFVIACGVIAMLVAVRHLAARRR